MQVKALLAGEPSFNPGMLVCGVIVANDVDLLSGATQASIFFKKASHSLWRCRCAACAGTLPLR